MSEKVIRYPSAADCPRAARHTPEPAGYTSWHVWAERKTRTYYQIRCPTCGFYAIWRKRSQPLTDAQMAAIFPHGDYEPEGAST